MTPASLEALARALARLEPDVFIIESSTDVFGKPSWIMEIDREEVMFPFRTDDDRLFGAVWRCAVARGMRPEVFQLTNTCRGRMYSSDGSELSRIEAPTPGVALALAYCAACGDKVSL